MLYYFHNVKVSANLKNLVLQLLSSILLIQELIGAVHLRFFFLSHKKKHNKETLKISFYKFLISCDVSYNANRKKFNIFLWSPKLYKDHACIHKSSILSECTLTFEDSEALLS